MKTQLNSLFFISCSHPSPDGQKIHNIHTKMSETFLDTEVPHQYITIANRKHIYNNLSEHIRRVLIELYNIKKSKRES